jgi:hypothetical protein
MSQHELCIYCSVCILTGYQVDGSIPSDGQNFLFTTMSIPPRLRGILLNKHSDFTYTIGPGTHPAYYPIGKVKLSL